MGPLSTFVISRKDGQVTEESIREQFSCKEEFAVHILNGHGYETPGILPYIISRFVRNEDELIVLCDETFFFAEHYSKELLLAAIGEARTHGADVLLGGIREFSRALVVSPGLLWVKQYSGAPFYILFRQFFPAILDADPDRYNSADQLICVLTDNKFLLHPFISGDGEGKQAEASNKMQLLKDVTFFYGNDRLPEDAEPETELADIAIPTYVMNLRMRTDRKRHIREQFAGKNEFDLTIVEACEHEVGHVGLWMTIRKIIELAIKNDDDVIIVCEDDHTFTEDYSRDYLLKNIIRANEQGVDYLNGGIGGFGEAMPTAETRFWVDYFYGAQFIVYYRRFFQKLLDEPFDHTILVDLFLSELSGNKLVLFPFISFQQDFGYSDVTTGHNERREKEKKGLIEKPHIQSSRQLAPLFASFKKYQTPNNA